MKFRRGLPSLRAPALFAHLRAVFGRAANPNFAIAHWSVQVDHVHLIVEADGREALSSGMARVDRAMARALNRLIGRRGAVLRERYHAHALGTPVEVRRALVYLLRNGHKHGVVHHGIDPMSSAPMFDGWADGSVLPASPDATVRAPRTWLLRIGWRKFGLIEPNEVSTVG